MDFELLKLELDGAFLVYNKNIADNCGYKEVFFDSSAFIKHEVDVNFKKDYLFYSEFRTFRGLYVQKNVSSVSKLMTVLFGSILVVVVDLRSSSDTFGQSIKFELSSDENCSLVLPEGVAFGYLTLSDFSCVNFKLETEFYDNLTGIRYDDKKLNIDIDIEFEPLVCDDVCYVAYDKVI